MARKANMQIIDCTRNGLAMVHTLYIYVTSLAILRTVTACWKFAGVTNDKESVLL